MGVDAKCYSLLRISFTKLPSAGNVLYLGGEGYFNGELKMPHWDDQGREEWVCQKAGHICTGKSTWVERDSELAKKLKCHGNVCDRCLKFYQAYYAPVMSVREHCKIESGLDGPALDAYINRYYGHG